jgi:hypothetical protein
MVAYRGWVELFIAGWRIRKASQGNSRLFRKTGNFVPST